MPISFSQLPGLGALNQLVPNKAAPEEKSPPLATRKGRGTDPKEAQAVALEVSVQARAASESAGQSVSGVGADSPELGRGRDLAETTATNILANLGTSVRAQAGGLSAASHQLI